MNIINKLYQNILNSLANLGVLSNIKSYSGDYKNGLKHGKGRMEFNDGSVYEGQFENNQMHGFGKIFFKDGSIYQGDFKNNLRDGKEEYSEEFIITWKKTLQGSIVIKASNSSVAADKVEALSNEELVRNSSLENQKENYKLINITQEV